MMLSEAMMDEVKFEKSQKIVDKYHDFLFRLPGFMYIGHNDSEIIIYIEPEKVELAKRFIANNIDGIPLKIEARTHLPSF